MKSRLKYFFNDLSELYGLLRVAVITFLVLYLIQAISVMAFGYGEIIDGTWAGVKVPLR